MKKTWFIGAALVLALVFPVVAAAHEGHTHKVLGTVSSVDGDHVTLKTTAGKTVVVMLDGKTSITRGTTRLDRTSLKTGERVSVDYEDVKGMFMAQAIKLGTAPAVATTKK
jgi:hypothetical protein